MWFWFFMLACNVMLPVFMILYGLFVKKFGAGTVNAVIGYRTTRSMKNQEAWEFANLYHAKLWIKIGCIMIPMCVIMMLPLIGRDTDTIGWLGSLICMVEGAILVISILPVEMAIKKKFGN